MPSPTSNNLCVKAKEADDEKDIDTFCVGDLMSGIPTVERSRKWTPSSSTSNCVADRIAPAPSIHNLKADRSGRVPPIFVPAESAEGVAVEKRKSEHKPFSVENVAVSVDAVGHSQDAFGQTHDPRAIPSTTNISNFTKNNVFVTLLLF